MTVVSRGERELIQRFDEFPQKAKARITAKIQELTQMLRARIEAAAPQLTGKLSSEIGSRVYSDSPTRVAGYVGIYAGDSKEYPKAATLEYGSDAVRKRFTSEGNRLRERISKPVHIEAFRYLRGPFAEIEGEVQAGIAEALQEAEAE